MLRRTGGGGNDAKLAFRGYGVRREGRARWELDAECRDRGNFSGGRWDDAVIGD